MSAVKGVAKRMRCMSLFCCFHLLLRTLKKCFSSGCFFFVNQVYTLQNVKVHLWCHSRRHFHAFLYNIQKASGFLIVLEFSYTQTHKEQKKGTVSCHVNAQKTNNTFIFFIWIKENMFCVTWVLGTLHLYQQVLEQKFIFKSI